MFSLQKTQNTDVENQYGRILPEFWWDVHWLTNWQTDIAIPSISTLYLLKKNSAIPHESQQKLKDWSKITLFFAWVVPRQYRSSWGIKIIRKVLIKPQIYHISLSKHLSARKQRQESECQGEKRMYST